MAEVTEIHVYPVHGEPGEDLRESVVEAGGLVGDRRKKAAVHVVAAEDLRDDTRANFVVSLASAELAASMDSVVRLGTVELDITGTARDCPGMYAAVRRPGLVRVGDGVEVVPNDVLQGVVVADGVD